MQNQYLTIKELTEAVGDGITPRMVRHYHASGLLPPAVRSQSNYRLYSQDDVRRLQRIVALKKQGFQLSHIGNLLDADSDTAVDTLLVIRLRRSDSATLSRAKRTCSDISE